MAVFTCAAMLATGCGDGSNTSTVTTVEAVPASPSVTSLPATTLAPSTSPPTTTAPTTTTTVDQDSPTELRLELVQTIAPLDGFNQPASVAVEAERLYVADSDNLRVVSFALDGTDEVVIKADGVALDLRDEGSLGAVDVDADGSLFVAESGTKRIIHMTATGAVLSMFEADPAFGRLFSLSVDRVNGLIYAVDDVNNEVVVFDREGTELRRILSRGRDPGEVSDIGHVEVLSDGTLWVADPGNHRVQHLTAEGEVIEVIGPADEGQEGYVEYANDVAVDAAGRVWLADFLAGVIVVFAPDGAPLARFGESEDADQLPEPVSLAFDAAGRLYVVERASDKVYVFDVA